MKMRIAKFMADAGVASRRKSEEMIKKGMVQVNGKFMHDPATNIDPDEDVIYVRGIHIKPKNNKIYIMLNKPSGCVSTCQDEKGRKTVLEYVKDIKERIYPVGRLDFMSEGLLIMTNDGELTNKLTHPRHEITKRYYVVINGEITEGEKEHLERGINLEDGKTAPAHVKIMKSTETRSELTITIHEGRNRQVRRMFEALGKKVIFLKRISEGDLNLGELKRGKYRYLTDEEVRYLKSL